MYVEKDLPVRLFGGGTMSNRAQRSSTRRGRRRKNVQELTPTSSTTNFSLPSPSPSPSPLFLPSSSPAASQPTPSSPQTSPH
ncbi:hypothetical protein K443DRAFT_683473 [Laccaria amethystina LaAM-08-1]|uniref:Uncharacterized protein n=1 Tax=Laccaria amethystina LaAM-08-1 TaxID=1095629 RepID=A0A0C9WSP5_9AGAR|nr:hypothetical protein K443DRAFT_683473 [Laccaria amethystina LaAM-08-1]